ncbi:MAG: 16S rRNA (uracil(1498)-N(3))-methyltransferase [Elainellaceae cyanobacterium]
MAGLQRISISSERRMSDILHLEPEQSHYLCRVLRLRRGDRFIALDEQDRSWIAALESDTCATIVTAHSQPTELRCRVTLQIAMPKAGMEDIIRQTTELGAHAIQPVFSDRVVLKPSPNKLNRWQRVAQEAAEQSERQHWPRVAAALPWNDVLKAPRVDPPQAGAVAKSIAAKSIVTRYICTARHPAPHLLTRLAQMDALPAALNLATGPEGGWTADEVARAVAAGYQPVSLGRRILRTVTAPVVAMSLVASVDDTFFAGSAFGSTTPLLNL